MTTTCRVNPLQMNAYRYEMRIYPPHVRSLEGRAKMPQENSGGICAPRCTEKVRGLEHAGGLRLVVSAG